MMTRRFHSHERLPSRCRSAFIALKCAATVVVVDRFLNDFLFHSISIPIFLSSSVCDTLVMPACLSRVGIWRMHAHRRAHARTREKLIIMLLPTMNGINNKITFCNLFQFKHCAWRRCVVAFSIGIRAGPFSCGFQRLAATALTATPWATHLTLINFNWWNRAASSVRQTGNMKLLL